MTALEYLECLLEQSRLAGNGLEIEALRRRRAEIEGVLRAAFPDPGPSIQYGGSKAKGTMVWVSYDLDMTCYFPCDDERSLEQIYIEVKDALDAAGYRTLEKTSAIRLHAGDDADFHVDVVPGRFFDESQTDVWLHQTQGTKERLKTNLEVHVDYVRESGMQDMICLMKLWRHRFALDAFRTFALELLTIEILRGWREKDLDAQLSYLFEELERQADGIAIEDPANPNNDLSGLLDGNVRWQLKAASRQTLDAVAQGGWQKVFGPLRGNDQTKQSSVRAAVAAATVRTKPWLPR